jgi:hypothetical protein
MPDNSALGIGKECFAMPARHEPIHVVGAEIVQEFLPIGAADRHA